ncbi:GGDEF domain-containing protein [Cupriavidus basilensis]|uniref:Diguanylate cyclase/phosphodiesterase (GGDEF & EAL domains) with PAS/PAC sensor(S) n=1 Tax=Cupriavidus basilensis TaxID=68895 RepID=A0A0C4YCF6_9BURK|nr:GGDEF domain-containing protein [Cupriavidus basilensis]AJG23277.1 diguanylate cyclase/phosphodiesterase (GGDEF & EAL domains) with PAS/PAC sensor(s) [Cupriavidus basilensis]
MHPDADDAVRSPEVDPHEKCDFVAALMARRQMPLATQPRFAVLVIHLDRFTYASETLGAALSTRLRAQAAARVAALAQTAEVNWLGQADIGAVVPLSPQLLPAADPLEAAMRLARAVAAGLARPFVHDGFELFLSSSIGVALDEPDKPAERSLHEAYDAMLRVRKRGGDGVAGGIATPASLSTPLLAALPFALARGQIALNLQARASLATGCVTGYTARLRWQSPELGRVAPQDFLPALESLGMMGEVARWLIENALPLLDCPGVADPVELSLLVSSAQLHGTALIDTLPRALAARKLDPARICLEIPGEALLADDHAAAAKLATLRGAGLRFALSDFADAPGGTSTLERLQPDLLTFDARCIGSSEQPGQAGTAARLQAACEQALRLGLPVCAKGIETRHQLAEVRRWGCCAIQGYLLAQPFPAHWLAQTHAAICARARELPT